MNLQDIFSVNYKEPLFKLISKNLPNMLWVKDIEGRYLFVNEAICNGLLMACDTNEPIGKTDLYFAKREREKHKDRADWHTFGELCLNSDLEVISNNRAMRFEEYGNVKGKLMYLEVNKAPFYDDKGNIIGTIGLGRDITKYKMAQFALEEEKRKLDESQRIAKVGTWEIDLETGKITWSDELYRIYNEDPKTFSPSLEKIFGFLNKEDARLIRSGIQDCIEKQTVEELQFSINRKDGKRVHILSRGKAAFDSNGKAVKVLGLSMDITDSVELRRILQKQKEELEHQINHDHLTQLPNRILFLERLKQSIYMAQRNNKKVAILFIDLDHFKEINDSLGHDVGDKVLLEMSKRMKTKMRISDTLARLSGDEFCIILNNIEDGNDIAKVIDYGMQVVKEPMVIDDHVLYIGMSIGISIYPQDGQSAIELLKNADAAVHRAKANGRNTYWYYDETMTKEAAENLFLESAMRKGLENDEFIPYFQPQIDIKTGSLIGMELLMRWKHPSKGLIPPYKFIPLAEKTGFIIEMDRYLMNKAMKLFSSWRESGLAPGKLSMNLASKQLESSDFFEILESMISDNGCEAHSIELEVTESDIMKDPETAIKKLQRLNDLGIHLAIDDFGTGYSSLAYLKRFPVHKLKIDRSFVMDIPENEDDKEIVKMIIGLCKILNLDVIAEGVETKEQSEFLMNNDCYLVQGYLYAKPMSADETVEYLRSKSV